MEKRHEGHHHSSTTKQVLLTLIVIVAVIILGVVIYYLVSGPSTDVYNLHCKIKSDVSKVTLSEGVGSSLSVSNYQGSFNDVSWKSTNPEIADINYISGTNVFVNANSKGTTQMVATDNAVGPECTTSITIIVGE